MHAMAPGRRIGIMDIQPEVVSIKSVKSTLPMMNNWYTLKKGVSDRADDSRRRSTYHITVKNVLSASSVTRPPAKSFSHRGSLEWSHKVSIKLSVPRQSKTLTFYNVASR